MSEANSIQRLVLLRKRDDCGRLRCQVCGFVQKDQWPDERGFKAYKYMGGIYVTCGFYECERRLSNHLEPWKQNANIHPPQ